MQSIHGSPVVFYIFRYQSALIFLRTIKTVPAAAARINSIIATFALPPVATFPVAVVVDAVGVPPLVVVVVFGVEDVGAFVGASVGTSVGASVGSYVGASVGASVGSSVGASVGCSGALFVIVKVSILSAASLKSGVAGLS